MFNVTLNLIDHGMTHAAGDRRAAAVDHRGRQRDHASTTASRRQRRVSQTTVDGLTALGYTVGTPADIGSVQAVLVDPKTGKQYGAADARREGTVIGLPRPAGKK